MIIAHPDRIKHLRGAIQRAIETRGKMRSHCPAHDDNNPSLEVRGNARGKLNVKCYAECLDAEVEEEIKALGLWPKKPRSRIVKTYDYQDENGILVYQKVRYEPKDFRLRSPDGAGGWKYSIKGLPAPPYRLPELLQATPEDRVLIVGGEKDCDNALGLGLFATTSHCGEGRNWPSEINHYFKGKRIIIIPDNDAAGELYAKIVAKNLLPEAQSVRIVRLPGLPPKGDLSDWIEQGGTREQLLKLIEETPTLSAADLADLEADPALQADDNDLAGLRKINDQWLLLINPTALLHIPTGELKTAAEFRLLEAPSGLAGAWLRWSRRRVAERLVYEPGQPRELPDGSYNLSPPIPQIPLDDASIERYYEGWITHVVPLVRHIFGSFNAPDAVTALQHAAYPIQHPGAKLSTAVLIYGPQGAGKSLLAEVVAAAYPRGETLECEVSHIFGKFNPLLLGKTFVFCNELLIGGTNPRKIADMLKNLITRQTVIIEPKNVNSFPARDNTNYWFTTNHPDAAYLEADDRRQIILKTNRERLDEAFGTRVGEWSKTDLGRNTMRFFLERYPIDATIFVAEKDQHTHQVDFNLKHYFEATGEEPGPFSSANLAQETTVALYLRRHTFHPKARAPMTEAKAEMIELGRSGLDGLAYELIEEARLDEADQPRTEPSHHDLVTLDAAATRKGVDLTRFSTKAWSMALQRMGAVKMRKHRVRAGKNLFHLWALSNTDHWSAAGIEAIGEAINQPDAKCLKITKY